MIRATPWIVPAPLRGHVARVVRLRGEGLVSDWLLPDVGAGDLAIFIGEPARVLGLRGPISAPRLFVGALGRALRVENPRVLDVVIVQLAAGCACALGAGAAALRDEVLPLDAIAPALDAALADWSEAFARGAAGPGELASVFGSRVGRCDRLVRRAAAELSLGELSVSAVGAACGLSRRQLTRRFQANVGVSPRAYVQIARFARAWRLAGEARPSSWARLAAEAGYCDQAHLVRDFAAFVGQSPTRVFTRDWYASVEPADVASP